jgi:arylsulfatase A-like enzyme
MIRVPGIEPRRVDAYAHPGDLAPTLLELAGVQVPESMTSASLVPILKGQREKNRDVAVSSWSLRDWSVHRPSIIRTDEWSMVFWRTGLAPLLYHVPSDPGEEKDVYGLYPKVAKELHRRYLEFLRANEAPLGNLLPRYFLFSRSSERTTGI